MEAAPQLTLQLYIIAMIGAKDHVILGELLLIFLHQQCSVMFSKVVAEFFFLSLFYVLCV